MSGQTARSIAIKLGLQKLADIPRDLYIAQLVAAAVFNHDVWQEDNALGLDFEVYNSGAAAVTVTIDQDKVFTVPAGAVRGFNNVLYSNVDITTGTFEVQIAGVRVN